MRSMRWMVGCAVIALVSGCGGCGGQAPEAGHAEHEEAERAEGEGHSEHEERGDEILLTAAQIDAAGIEIRPAAARPVSGFIRATGEIQADPDRMVQLGSTVSGRVTMARGQVGERVRPGQVLATVIAAEAATASAEVPAAQARLELAREAVARERSLVERGISPRRDLLAAAAELRQAEAGVAAARGRAGALASSLVSPIAGVIAERRASVGQAVEPGEALYTVVDPTHLVAILDVYGRDMAAVREGARVSLTSEAARDRAFTGRVRGLSPVIDETTRTAKIRVELSDGDGWLRPGLFVTGLIESGREVERGERAADSAVIVPSDAVFRMGERHVVFVAEDETDSGVRFAAREVEQGVRLDGEVEIRRGVEPGDRIATRGGFSILSALRAGELGEGHAD